MNIVIVGASSGLGLETARILVSQGHRVGVAARRREPLLEFQATAPEQIFVATIDVNTPEAPQQLLDLIDRMGGMDIYLHSSGVGFTNMELDMEKELIVVRTNALGFTQMTDTAFRYFAGQGRKGHIAVISSVAGTKGLGASPAYSATKRYQYTYLQSLAQLSHIKGYDIAFTDIRPGFVNTAFIKDVAYPAIMDVVKVAHDIVRALHRRQRVVIIDWRYRCLVAIWRLIPDWLWERMKIRG